MENKTVLLKLWSGCMIIGTMAGWTSEGNADLRDPRMVAVIPAPGGRMQVALANVCEPFAVKRLREGIQVPKAQIMFILDEDELDKDLVNGYKSEVSGIRLATAADAAKLAGKGAPGEIIL